VLVIWYHRDRRGKKAQARGCRTYSLRCPLAIPHGKKEKPKKNKNKNKNKNKK
jgi:hypothetical protein